jgi:hypothetical protein
MTAAVRIIHQIIFSVRVEMLIALSASHESGVRRMIFSRGIVRAAADKIAHMSTQCITV